MTNLLINIPTPMTELHFDTLQAAVPNSQLIYCANEPSVEQLENADFIFGNTSVQLLKHCKKLRLLQLHSSGIHIRNQEMLPTGCIMATATGAYGLAVSEHMLSMLLMLMKNLHKYHSNQIEHRWQDAGAITSVYGSTTLVIGIGDIGGEFSKRIKALGGRTIGVRRADTNKPDYLDELYNINQLDKLLPQADIVALSLPSTKDTIGLMDARKISLLKKSAFLLNVGRGDVLDQEALCDALDDGRLAGAGLDVTTPEPIPYNHRLWDTPNILITPHVSGGVHLAETFNRVVQIAANNFSAYIKGDKIKNEVDFSTGYRKL